MYLWVTLTSRVSDTQASGHTHPGPRQIVAWFQWNDPIGGDTHRSGKVSRGKPIAYKCIQNKTTTISFKCFLPYVVMPWGFINKSCVSRILYLNRGFFSLLHLVAAWLSAQYLPAQALHDALLVCPHSHQSRQSLSWEMVGA